MVVAVVAVCVDALDAAFRFLKNDEVPEGSDEEENPYENFYWESWPGERDWLRNIYENGDEPHGGWEKYGGLPAIFPELFPDPDAPGGSPAATEEGELPIESDELGMLGPEKEEEDAPRSTRLGIEHGMGPMGTRETVDRETGEAGMELVPQRGRAGSQQYATPDRMGAYKYRSAGRDTTRGKRWQDPQELLRREIDAYHDAPHRVADLARDRDEGSGAWRAFGEDEKPPEGHVTVRSKFGTRHIPAETYTKPHPAFVRFGETEVDEDGA